MSEQSGRSPDGRGSDGRGSDDPGLSDGDFLDDVTARLAALPGVRAVSLGGSRARGVHRPDSDWDVGVYYRGGGSERAGADGEFDPARLRETGWDGEVSGIGEWGGVFNGGAWLTAHGRRVDVHYRDLDVVEHEIAEAEAGRFHWEPLMFHLAGIPSYLLLAELALNRVLYGELPRPAYPRALRESAPAFWLRGARLTLRYAESNHAPRGRPTEVAGALASAAVQAGHAVLAARGEWVTNEKGLLQRAGLAARADELMAELPPDPAKLTSAVRSATALIEEAARPAEGFSGRHR